MDKVLSNRRQKSCIHFADELGCQEICACMQKMSPVVVVVVKWVGCSAGTYEVISLMPSHGGHILKQSECKNTCVLMCEPR